VPAALLAACPDPGGGFDDFVKRSEPFRIELPELDCKGAVDFSGHYLFGASVVIGRDKPLRFDATITIDKGSTPWGVDWSMRALSVADGSPVGDVIHAVGSLSAAGVVFIDVGTLAVPGEADTILADVPVETTFLLSGCSESATFACGPFDGEISKPTVVPLAGSTWGLAPVPEGQAAKDVALVAACPGAATAEGDASAESAPEMAGETTP
jgi:hypothetical protein